MNIKDDVILKDIDEGYLVGGMVRDYFLGEKSNDRDIVIKNAKDFSQKLAKQYDASLITLDDENKIYRIVLKDKENYIDVSELRGETIEEDLHQRDFTINAIAYDLKKEQIIDVTGGVDDIKSKTLRFVKEENFKDDPLRILRAFRFMAVLGFEPTEELISVLEKYMSLATKPAEERIRDEIMKLFGGEFASETLLRMFDIGLLDLIFPVVKDIQRIPSNSHHHLDLIHHVIETVRQIEIQYNKAEGEILDHLNKVDFGGYPRINHLKLAGFLHDIGKPSTWTIEESGRHRFIKHDLEGAKIVVPLLKKLKFSNKQIDYISDMIRQHIYPSSVVSAPNADDKIMMRYVRKMGDNVIDNIILAKADRYSAQGPAVTREMTENNINGLDKLLNFYLDVKPRLAPLPKLLDGNDIMQMLNITQSPVLGIIIKELYEAQLNGEISTKEEAEIFIKDFCKKRY